MSNLKLVINNSSKEQNHRYFFEKKELKIILDLLKWYLKDLGKTMASQYQVKE